MRDRKSQVTKRAVVAAMAGLGAASLGRISACPNGSQSCRSSSSMLSAFITGLEGPELSAREAGVLREARPCGVILFARNAVDPQQLRRLTDAATAAVGEEILVLIDQEGGRVQRLRPPHWRALPPA